MNNEHCYKLTFSVGSKYLLPGIKIVASNNYWWPFNRSTIVRFMTKQNSVWSKALKMPLTIWNCVLSYK